MAKFEVPVLSRNLRIGNEEGHDHVVRITGVSAGARTQLHRTRISLEIAVAATGRTLKCLGPKNEIFALQGCYAVLIDS